MLTGEIENQIDNDKVCSEFAVETVCNMYADMFASMDDELMQQRAADMRHKDKNAEDSSGESSRWTYPFFRRELS